MVLQLRRVLGFYPHRRRTLLFHPDGERCIYSIGSTIVISSFTDPENQTILRGHVGTVSHMALDPAGHMLISAEDGEDSDVCIWNLETDSLHFRFSEHDFGVSSANYSADGLFYVSYGAQDKMLFISETASSDIVCKRKVGDLDLACVLFGGRIKDERGRKLALYNLLGYTQSGAIVSFTFDPKTSTVQPIPLTTGPVKRVVRDIAHCTKDRSLMIAGSMSGEILVIDAVKNTFLSSIQLPNGAPIECITVFPGDGKDLDSIRPVYTTYERLDAFDETIAAGGHGFISIIKGQGNNWNVCATLSVPGRVTNLSADSLGRILAGTDNGSIILIIQDDSSYKAVPISENHIAPATSACFAGSGDSTLLITVAADNTCRIWDLKDFYPGLTIDVSPNSPSAVYLNEIQILIGCTNGDLLIYDIENGDKLLSIQGADRIAVTSLYGHRTRILVGGSHGDVREWDLRSRKMVGGHKEHTLRVANLSLTGDGVIVSAAEDKYIIASKNGTRVSDFLAEGPIRGMTLIGDTCAISCGRIVALVDVPKRRQLNKVELGSRMTSITHNTKYIFAGSEAGTLYVFTHGLELVEEIPAHAADKNLHYMACTEEWLCTMDSDGCVMVWSM